MMYSVFLYSTAQKDFDELQASDRVRIAEALRELGNSSTFRKNVKKVNQPLMGYRKRVGRYRILFTVKDNTVAVHGIRQRKEAYR